MPCICNLFRGYFARCASNVAATGNRLKSFPGSFYGSFFSF